MVTSFGALYAGYIDLEHVGYGGTPVEARWYPNDRLIEVFENARAMAQPPGSIYTSGCTCIGTRRRTMVRRCNWGSTSL